LNDFKFSFDLNELLGDIFSFFDFFPSATASRFGVFGNNIHVFRDVHDQFTDIASGLFRDFGKVTNLIGHDRKTTSVLTRARSFNRGVQSE
jgi:hypothetical protein